MKAAILTELNTPLVIEDIGIPALEHGQALVRVHASGICGRQIHEISGACGPDKYLPHLLGHEGAGVVESIGPGVMRVKPGDHVVLHWRKGRGIESGCPRYPRGGGPMVGGGWVTTFNEQAVVSENRLTVIDRGVPFHIAALMGCAVTTGLGVILREAQVRPGQSVAVIGCGGVGLMTIQGARIAQAGKIMAFDCFGSKLVMAEDFGATIAHPASMLNEAKGFDVFIDTTGLPDVIAQAYALAAPGGKVVMVGQPKRGEALVLDDVAANFKGKTLMDSAGGSTDPNLDIPKYLDFYRRGLLRLDSLITHRVPLDRINDGLDIMRQGLAGRVIVEMPE